MCFVTRCRCARDRAPSGRAQIVGGLAHCIAQQLERHLNRGCFGRVFSHGAHEVQASCQVGCSIARVMIGGPAHLLCPHRPEAQDVALSRPKRGFESRWGRNPFSATRFFDRLGSGRAIRPDTLPSPRACQRFRSASGVNVTRPLNAGYDRARVRRIVDKDAPAQLSPASSPHRADAPVLLVKHVRPRNRRRRHHKI